MITEKIVETIAGPPTEDWMARKWRPAMGWMYMTVCIFDFILFPMMWAAVQAIDAQGSVTSQWSPITLQGGGLFHVAMGAVLGVAAYGRTQEKLNNSTTTSTMVIGPPPPKQPEL